MSTRMMPARPVRTGRHGVVVTVTALVVVALGGPGAAYPRPGSLEIVSAAADGSAADASAGGPASVSADGRHVAFVSWASNLVPDDTNGGPDIFVRDRLRGTIERITVSSTGQQANGWSVQPSISADGTVVGFHSNASNLVGGDSNGTWDTFVHDRATGTTERVSVSTSGVQSNGLSYKATPSGDGRYVSFDSAGSTLVPGDTNGTWDVFVRDRVEGTTERVSVTSEGQQASGGQSRISADGRYVAFESGDAGLQGGPSVLTADVFVHDRVTGVTERVSASSHGDQGNGPSSLPSISADGRYVAFESYASNLVPSDTNGASDVFVHDRKTGLTERVSVGSAGEQQDDHYLLGTVAAFVSNNFGPAISGDGRYVAFSSVDRRWLTLIRDRATGATEIVSLAPDGSSPNGDAWFAAINGDGRYVSFESAASNLVSPDENEQTDIFVRDRGPALGAGSVGVARTGSSVTVSGWAGFSGTTIASGTDEAHDVPAVTGADLTAAEVIHRPESEDLLVRISVSDLPGRSVTRCLGQAGCPGVQPGAPTPGVLYVASLVSDGVRYEIRADRSGASGWVAPRLVLYRCSPGCSEASELRGSLGSTGERIEASVPLSALGEPSALSDVRVTASVGTNAGGGAALFDAVSLGNAAIAAPTLRIDLSDGSTLVEAQAASADGVFSHTFQNVGPGPHEATVRACLSACGPPTRVSVQA